MIGNVGRIHISAKNYTYLSYCHGGFCGPVKFIYDCVHCWKRKQHSIEDDLASSVKMRSRLDLAREPNVMHNESYAVLFCDIHYAVLCMSQNINQKDNTHCSISHIHFHQFHSDVPNIFSHGKKNIKTVVFYIIFVFSFFMFF